MNIELLKQKRHESFLKKVNTPMGRGAGLHLHIFACANFGLSAGLPANEVASIIKQKYPDARPGEIEDSVRNAISTYQKPESINPNNYVRKTESVFKLTSNIATLSVNDVKFENIVNLSPIDVRSNINVVDFLCTLYSEDDYIFIGNLLDDSVFKLSEWVNNKSINKFPLLVANPLTGEFGKSKGGKTKLRCSETVKEYKYCVAEMDTVEIDKQISFWVKIIERNLLPVVSVVYSGNKSLHVLIKVNCGNDQSKWNYEVREILYKKCLALYGCDVACATIERMTRLPFHKREDGNYQELLYLRKI